MNILIDTQVLIWVQQSNVALSAIARAALSNPANHIFASQISFFEIAIKHKIGKLIVFDVSVDEFVDQTARDGIQTIQLDRRHISTYNQIPLFADHRDPFDRLILATALAEKMSIISADEKFQRYQDIVPVIW